MKLFAHLEHICHRPVESPGTVCAIAQRRETEGVQGVNYTLKLGSTFVVMAGCLFFGLASFGADKINGVINFQGDTVHLEFFGQQNWEYDVKRLDKKGQTVVQMTVPAID